MKKNTFGDKIEYEEVFVDVVYIKNKELKDVKLYDTDEFDISEPIESKKSAVSLSLLPDRKKYKSSIRKIIFSKQKGDGIIIGQGSKREGEYHPACGGGPPYYDDYEQAWLDVTKTYTFWIVANKMNQTILVPKK